VGHWVWGGSFEGQPTGWLAKLGFIDFAGCTVVHQTGGVISLAALFILGPRMGRYNDDGSVNRITGSNLQTSVIGAILLWFGWIGFNGGSTLSLNNDVPAIIMRTTLAGAAGLVVTLLIGWRLRGYPDVSLVVNGAIAGLVAVTAACAYVNTWQSVVIGAVGGIVMLALEWFLDSRQIDDAVTAIPVHLGAGLWGTLAVGIFGDPALLKTGLSREHQILIQAGGALASGLFAFVVAYIAIAALNRIHPIRVGPEEEAIGLNVVEHKASTEMYDLYRTLEEQARTGDLTLRAPVEPFTEVGQIADRYNNLLDSLEKNLVARSEYVNILDNVSDGLLLIDASGNIGPHYSQALETIFEEMGLAGKNFAQLLRARMPESKMEAVSEFLRLMFDANTNAQTILRLNPLTEAELLIDLHNGRFAAKFAQFFFKRVMKGDRVASLLVIVRDVTQQKKMAMEFKETRDSQRSEMELFSKVIQIEPALLAEFMESFLYGLDSVNEVLESNSRDYAACLDQILRAVHLLKGDADTLGLDFIAEQAHAFEEQISEVKGRPDIGPEDFLPISITFRAFKELHDRLDGILSRVAAFQNSFTSGRSNGNASLLPSLQKLVDRLASRHGKQLELDTVDFDFLKLPEALGRPVREALIQLIRNSVAHGIESTEERLAAHKPPAGVISISLSRGTGGVQITYSDDGRGFDFEAVRRTAVSAGAVSKEAAASLSNRELVSLVFSPGFSTAGKETMTAGRGVGLDAVKDIVKSLGGRIAFRNRPGTLCEFRVTLPLPRRDGDAS
ncbi:MAG: Hpt domain-containing protein, partial [Spirochaetia bacterium]|nr:Hpt domain-containing protein [Spirochaetia bacterium]